MAEADFVRLRWSETILDEPQSAIAAMLSARGLADAIKRAARARRAMVARPPQPVQP